MNHKESKISKNGVVYFVLLCIFFLVFCIFGICIFICIFLRVFFCSLNKKYQKNPWKFKLEIQHVCCIFCISMNVEFFRCFCIFVFSSFWGSLFFRYLWFEKCISWSAHRTSKSPGHASIHSSIHPSCQRLWLGSPLL